ncbi:hypothetical protein QNI19_13415 [Cytophagaceae bacterium DM2B3-1]|uniref:Uncharacterized protein n=1 Tax=Xanthocytophaga flava TaxID=3048013 RepID=A0ABT7CJN0_9BACT|nr:hypothetical protein [Xanthocytophaga flavus]MDJ1467858.1 hypothetical protein [Xanthocytophaga flavus]MDJ1493936.1 hypothetical protein [Xanthocytophaga flavus]
MSENRISSKQIQVIIIIGLVYLCGLCFYDSITEKLDWFSLSVNGNREQTINDHISQVISRKIPERISLPSSKGKFIYTNLLIQEESQNRYRVVVPVTFYTNGDTLQRDCVVKLAYKGGEPDEDESWDIVAFTLLRDK